MPFQSIHFNVEFFCWCPLSFSVSSVRLASFMNILSAYFRDRDCATAALRRGSDAEAWNGLKMTRVDGGITFVLGSGSGSRTTHFRVTPRQCSPRSPRVPHARVTRDAHICKCMYGRARETRDLVRNDDTAFTWNSIGSNRDGMGTSGAH